VKKRLIIIVATAAVVALAVWILVLFSGNQGAIDSGDESSLYSYTYQQNGKSVLVGITGDFEKKSWSAESSSEDAATVQEKSNGKRKASFLIKPANNGSAKVTMTLVDEENENKGYQIVFSAFVDSDGVIEILDTRYVAGSNQQFSGTVGESSYSILVTGGEMSVGFIGEKSMEWYTESDLYNTLTITGPDRQLASEFEDGSSTAADLFTITAKAAGTGYIRFVNPQMTTALEVTVSVSYDNIVTVLSANAVSYTPKEVSEYNDAMALINLMGGEKLIPSKLSPTSYFYYSGETKTGKSYAKAGMSLSINGKKWSYELYSTLTLSEVIALNTAQTTASYITAGTKTVTLLMGDSYAGAVWQEENCVCQLSGMEDTIPTSNVTTKAVQTLIKELESAK